MNAGEKLTYWIDGALVEHTVTEEEARRWQAAPHAGTLARSTMGSTDGDT